MPIAFQDFVPQAQRKRLGVRTDFERLHEVVSRANRWIEQNQIEVINVETILLTDLPKGEVENPPTQMTAPGTTSFSIYQVVRIWYRQKSEAGLAYTGQTTPLTTRD